MTGLLWEAKGAIRPYASASGALVAEYPALHVMSCCLGECAWFVAAGWFFCLLVYLSADEKVSCDDAGSVIELKLFL